MNKPDKNGKYVELQEEKLDQNFLEPGNSAQNPQKDSQPSNLSERETECYFKTCAWKKRLGYWLNHKKECADHVYRIIKPYPMNEKSAVVWDTKVNIFPPVSTSNKVDNMKYGFLMFVPLFFYNQFKYFFNMFFLLLCISQFIEPLKIGFLFTYIGPLIFVLSLSLFNELTDELKRFCRDLEVNRKRVTVVNLQNQLVTKTAGDLRIGEIVLVREGESCPADLLILHSDQEDGKCQIKTDQIDGETDTKIRRAVPYTQELIDSKQNVLTQQMEMVVDTPNDLIYKFQGALHEVDTQEKNILKKHAIGLENSIWAQCRLSKGNIHGLVMYTGSDTKLMMSMEKSDPKRSLVDEELNTLSKLLFVLMVSAAALLITIKGLDTGWIIQFFRYILLLCSIIPLSMKVNQDISKLFFAQRINNDKQMKDCLSRNSMIAEDLGRIEYFLTDKTGTLTKNEMIMKKLNIVSRTLDTSKIEDMTSLGISSSNKKELKFLLPDDKNDDTHFFRAVAVLLTCHAVFPKLDKFGFKVLDSTSPDELSFIEFCEKIGFKLLKRTDHLVSFSTPDKREFEFKILRIFPFTSARQRMGVILEWNNTILYFLKGADSKMIPTLKKIYKEKTAEETAQLSAQGLRTLVISQKILLRDELDRWTSEYNSASVSLSDRENMVEQCIEKIETDMDLIGVTAVEDLLQDDVKASIETLRKAGIKVWMLTGDKMETAKTISVTTGLYSSGDTLFLLDGINDKYQMREKLNELLVQIKTSKSAFLLIDGMSLALATRHGNLDLFLSIASKISSVCCCRCAPSQKREITKAVKLSGKRVLGIGDGGNDVGMIEEAHIGIGISGREGKQAALSSDYSIGEFKAVVKLLLWHGRLVYRTTAKTCMFIMHRGMIIATMQFCFTVMFFLIDVPLFNGILMFGYSTIFTNLPVISIITDVDLPFEAILDYPILYRSLLKGRLLNVKSFIIMVIKAMLQGTLIMYLTNLLFPRNYFDIVTIEFTALILTELLNTTTMTSKINFLQIVLLVISLLIYITCIFWLKAYINLGTFGPLFLIRIGIIVMGSWGVIFLAERIYNHLYPSITKRIIEQTLNENSIDDKPEGFGRRASSGHKPLLDEKVLKEAEDGIE